MPSKNIQSIITLLLLIPAMILSAIIIQDMWGWFIVPLGVVAIGKAHALGLSTFISYFKIGLASSKEVSTDPKLKDQPLVWFLGMVAIMLMSWGTAAIIHSFM
jgi:hypothetical protein